MISFHWNIGFIRRNTIIEKNTPTLSIIVPIHNAEKELGKCINSILQQTYTDFECLIVNDESTDRSKEIAVRFTEQDSRVRLINQKWGGVSKARNNGIKEARGRYIGFVDGDDFIEPDMYATLIEMIERFQADISCCNIDYCREDGVFEEHAVRNIPEVMSREEFMVHIFDRPKTIMGYVYNKLYRRELVKDLFNENHKMCEDMEFLINYGISIKTSTYVNRPFYHVYMRKGSASRNVQKDPSDELSVRASFIAMLGKVSNQLRDISEADFLDACLLYDKSNKMLKNIWRLIGVKECTLKLKTKCLMLALL